VHNFSTQHNTDSSDIGLADTSKPNLTATKLKHKKTLCKQQRTTVRPMCILRGACPPMADWLQILHHVTLVHIKRVMTKERSPGFWVLSWAPPMKNSVYARGKTGVIECRLDTYLSHFRCECLQAIDCTDTDNHTQNNQDKIRTNQCYDVNQVQISPKFLKKCKKHTNRNLNP